jgi:hypothetical protein
VNDVNDVDDVNDVNDVNDVDDVIQECAVYYIVLSLSGTRDDWPSHRLVIIIIVVIVAYMLADH